MWRTLDAVPRPGRRRPGPGATACLVPAAGRAASVAGPPAPTWEQRYTPSGNYDGRKREPSADYRQSRNEHLMLSQASGVRDGLSCFGA